MCGQTKPNKQTIKQTKKTKTQTHKQTNKQTNQPTNRKTEKHTNKSTKHFFIINIYNLNLIQLQYWVKQKGRQTNVKKRYIHKAGITEDVQTNKTK